MSDAIKLSELLEAGAASLSVAAEESVTSDLVQQFMGEAKALRAIAPTLIEVVRNSARTCSCAFGCPDCPHCKLYEAMKAAGVTCE